MNQKKERVQVKLTFRIWPKFLLVCCNFRGFALVASSCVDEYDNVEEERDEDEGDAGQDPLGQYLVDVDDKLSLTTLLSETFQEMEHFQILKKTSKISKEILSTVKLAASDGVVATIELKRLTKT